MQKRLKRSLTLFQVVLYGVGIIVGAGIYALIGEAAALAGNAVWLSFAIGAVIAVFTGLSYAELSSMYPKAGGEFVYIEHAFSKRIAFLVGWLVLIAGVIASAAVALGFAGYFNALTGLPITVTAVLLVLLLSLVDFWGIQKAARINEIATVIGILGLILIIMFSTGYLGSVNYLELSGSGVSGVIKSTALIFFAFLGFESIVRFSEETKNPRKIIPKAIIISIIVATTLYILTALSVVSVVGWKELSLSKAPLALVAEQLFGKSAFAILSIIALFATFSTVLVSLIATVRMLFGMAEDRGMPRIFEKVYRKFNCPWAAIVAVGIATALFALIGKIKLVASLTDFAIFGIFAFVNLSLVVLRVKRKKMKRPFRTSAALSLLGGAASFFMMFQFGLAVFAGGIAMVIAGLGVYELMRKNGLVSEKVS